MSDRFIKDITDTIDKDIIKPLLDTKLVQSNQLERVYECFAFIQEKSDIIFIILDELFKLYLRYKTPKQNDLNEMIRDLKKNANSLQTVDISNKLKQLNMIPEHIQNYIVECYRFVALRYTPEFTDNNNNNNNNNNNQDVLTQINEAYQPIYKKVFKRILSKIIRDRHKIQLALLRRATNSPTLIDLLAFEYFYRHMNEEIMQCNAKKKYRNALTVAIKKGKKNKRKQILGILSTFEDKLLLQEFQQFEGNNDMSRKAFLICSLHRHLPLELLKNKKKI